MSDKFIKIHAAYLDRMKREIEGYAEMWIRADTIFSLWNIQEDDNPYRGATFIKTGDKNETSAVGCYIRESPEEILELLAKIETKPTYKFDVTHQELPPPPPILTC